MIDPNLQTEQRFLKTATNPQTGQKTGWDGQRWVMIPPQQDQVAPPMPLSAIQSQPMQTATHPKTGQKAGWDGKQWSTMTGQQPKTLDPNLDYKAAFETVVEPAKEEDETKLFEQLRGYLPKAHRPETFGPESPEFAITEPQRQKAFDILSKKYTPERMQFIMDINKRIETPPGTGRAIGGTVGALALPALLNLVPPFAALPEEVATVPLALAKFGKAAAPYIGAGLGGGIGEAAQIALEEKRLLSKREFLGAFAKEVTYEGGGRSFVRGGKFALAPFIKRPISGMSGLADDFAKVGGVLDPTALDKRFTTSVAVEISRGAFGARQVFEEMGQKSGRAARTFAGSMLDLMADSTARLGPEQLGEEFAEGVARPRGFVFRQIHDVIDGLYKRLDDLTEAKFKRIFRTVQTPTGMLDEAGRPITKATRRATSKALVAKLSPGFEELEEFVPVGVSTRKLKRFWIEVLQENKKALKLGRKGAFTLTPGAIKEGEKVVYTLGDTIPHKTMRNIRSRVLRDIKKLHIDANQDEALIKRFEQVMFDTLTDPQSVKGMTPEIQNLFNNTRSLYTALREATETVFPEKLLKRIAKKPSSVIRELFPRNNPTVIKKLRISLAEPIGGIKSPEGIILWKQLRTAWFDDAVEQATKGGVVKPNVFENIVFKQGKDAIKEMLPDKEGMRQYQTIKDLLTAMSKKPAAGASLFIRGGQVGGLYMLYQGTRDGDVLQVTTGGALVGGPYFFAKMAAHPLGSKLLRSGLSLKPGSTSLVPIGARLVNLARKIDRDEASKRIKAAKQKHWKELQQKVPSYEAFRGFGGRGF